MDERPGRRWAAAAQRFNRNPKLVGLARRTRERTLGDDEFVDHLSTARGRPSDLAARQLVELRGDEPGFVGELGLTALQAWQRLAESQDRGRGKVDVAILFTDLVGFRAGRWRPATAPRCDSCARSARRSSRRCSSARAKS